jgi:hypothetical protein
MTATQRLQHDDCNNKEPHTKDAVLCLSLCEPTSATMSLRSTTRGGGSSFLVKTLVKNQDTPARGSDRKLVLVPNGEAVIK